MGKRVYIETYGCQMNEHDTERILRLLEGFHYLETKDAQEADVILINTCSVREKPEHKVYSALGRFKWLKEKRGAVIGVAGCVAQQEGDRLLDRIPYLDMVIGTHAIPMLPQLLQKIEVSGERVCKASFDPAGNYLKTILPQEPLDKVRSYVTIMQGCDHFCSFCIVPYVRGREQSRPSREIIEEVERLVEMGVKEVCLLGQNVNGYGKGVKEEISFSELLERINEIEGLDRVRFTTSHPRDLSEELIQAYSKLSKLCDHIHLPFQSGSDKILKTMHRGYTEESYLERIDRLKKVCPSIAVTADVIVGFPGEEERDFEETLNLIQKVRFDDLFSFKYSPRKGTRAAQFTDKVEEKVKQDRLSVLQEIQKEITLQKNQELEGRVEEVLVEGRSKQSHQDVTGRTRTNKIVNFEGDLSLVGQLVPVRITKAYPHSLRGESLGVEFACSPQCLLCRSG
ncbi:MAG: tRNA (N6-isopentenyl adenosine(37)-C2)-methylthiotransferase MiaB [Deltaproteobacteria bacterium RBG_16_47_11]|nr:MAG: tRNA (N6-isopentenyl adenosine(37)-C2)-methylthiotransferase MiaB [Deltaproteobacteria bacterium RBG_16_47_11]